MKLGVHVGYWGMGLTREDQLAIVQEAERLGYDSVWTAEAYGSDAATILGWIAGQTTTIRIGSAIFQMPGRSPAMTAMTAATLDQLSDGRMILGIGSSGPQVAEGWHGQRFGHQIQRTREYVAVVRQALSRERLEFHGETLELPLPDGPGKALKLTIAPVQERIPIYLAAIGPNNTRLAGEVADGWIPTLFSPEHVAEFRPLLEEGAARAGRDLNGFDIAPTVQVFVTDDLAGARDAMRPFIALYVGGMGSRKQNFYNQLVQRYGFEDAAREVQDLYLDGKREEAMAELPDELIDHGGARRPARSRARAPGRLPRRRRRDPGHHADGVGPGGAPRAAAPHRRACRRLTVRCGCCWAPSATRGTRSRSSRSGSALVARGHEVVLQTWTRWEGDVTAAGMRFEAAPEYHVFPTRERPLKPYEAVVRATGETRPLVAALRPDAVVADILTLAPALAGELEGVPVATVIPHTDPRMARGLAALLGGGAAAAHARGTARVGRPVAADRRGPRARAPRAQRDAPAPGARAAGSRARRDLAGAGAGGDLPGARVPARGRAARDPHRGPAAVGAAGGRRGAAARRRPARARGALDLAGPVAPAAARDAARPRRARRCGSSPCGTAGRWASRSTCPPTRAWSIGSPTRGRCRSATSSSATAATAPSRARWPAAAPSSSSPPPAT